MSMLKKLFYYINMLDIKWIKNNLDALDKNLVARKMKEQSKSILKLYQIWRNLISSLNDLRQKSKLAAKKRDFDLGKQLKAKINSMEMQVKDAYTELNDEMSRLPNIISNKTPIGDSEDNNVEMQTWGSAVKKDHTHDEIMQHFKLWHDPSNVSGSRFAIMSGFLSKLERSIAQWMLDFNVKSGFNEVSVPFIAKNEALYNSGQLPKFKEDLFTFNDKALIPTGEVPLVNMVSGQILKSKELPMRFTTLSHCFRKEAGSAGKDTKGLIRLHQFQKVEIVSITNQDSEKEHEFMLEHAKSILQALELPYRVIEICSGDIGFTANRQFDIEVWMAGANKYVEIASCSNCVDFQARRMNTRYVEGTEKHFVHTLNCSALAVGRTLAAILENCYKDGVLYIPSVLQDYVGMEKYKC